ncbi:TetR/AcrR family transcriptional regulator [Paenibacillus sp.]|uniref:TetR/AcrR family transcriptional regulator n=1 Tax=Paenibacillus sp. TaxID=58172 RepID=UPI002D30C22E|nr:WHG domain-containing protein [Paenibacillus sp.]HZG84579.1 WHG domain-containing protein [Paenibacillus sp.]
MSPRAGLDMQTIVKTAADVADEQGWEQVSLGELAKRLNVRTPSLYNHIEGLPALRQRLAIHGLGRLLERMTAAAVGRSGDEAVMAMSEAYLAFARAHPGLYEATFRAPKPDDPEFGRAQSAVVELVLQVLRPYGLSDAATLHTIRGLRSILHGFASIERSGGFGMPLDTDESFRLLLGTFLAGVHAAAKKEQP